MRKKIALFTLFLLVIITSCHHEPDTIAPDCTVTGVTYENYIKFTMEDKCLGCHVTNSIQPYLDSYAKVMVVVNDGRLKEVVTGAPGVMRMPYNSDPLPDCMIENIVSWIDNGAPEN